MLQKFDVRFDDEGRMLVPKPIMQNVGSKNLVMILTDGEIRIMSKAKSKIIEVGF